MKKTFAVAVACVLLFPYVSFAAFSSDLHYGSVGKEVSALQQFLVNKGLLVGSVTGKYLSLTANAVKKFQQSQGINPSTGYFGTLTRAIANKNLTAAASFATLATTNSINVGGSATTGFVSDGNASGGQTSYDGTYVDTSDVSNPPPQAVYQTQRYGNFTYTVPNLTPGATYGIRINFDEGYWNSAGQRKFNVSINGSQVLTNYDIFAKAGNKYKATAESFTTTADGSGKIVIIFTSIVDNATVAGIEVTKTGSGASADPTSGTAVYLTQPVALGPNYGTSCVNAPLSIPAKQRNVLIAEASYSSYQGAKLISGPSGYNQLGNYTNGDQSIAVFYKIASGGETTASWTQSSIDGFHCTLSEYGNAQAPINFSGASSSVAPTISAPNNAVVVNSFAANGNDYLPSNNVGSGWFDTLLNSTMNPLTKNNLHLLDIQSISAVSGNSYSVAQSSDWKIATSFVIPMMGSAPAPLLGVNSGGSALPGFSSDLNVNGGQNSFDATTVDTGSITNPPSQSFYQSQRYGNFTYTLPNLKSGSTYTVRLDFDEPYWNSAGQRKFNVSMNGLSVLTNYDIVGKAGNKFKATAESFTTTADSSGRIIIAFTSVLDNATVAGIEIAEGNVTNLPSSVPVAPTTPTTPTPTPTVPTPTIPTPTPITPLPTPTPTVPTPTPTIPTPSPIPSTPKFIIGQRIQTNDNVNVRSSASISGSLLGTQVSELLGTVVAGPTTQGGYNWWNVNYDAGVDGWSVENYLSAYNAPAQTPLSDPTNGSGVYLVQPIAVGPKYGVSCSNAPLAIPAKKGDLLVAQASYSSYQGASLVSSPSGYTQLGSYNDGDQSIAVFYKFATGGETSASWTQSSVDGFHCTLAEYANAQTPTNFYGSNSSVAPTIYPYGGGVIVNSFAANGNDFLPTNKIGSGWSDTLLNSTPSQPIKNNLHLLDVQSISTVKGKSYSVTQDDDWKIAVSFLIPLIGSPAAPLPPTCTLSASPTLISAGQSTTLTWSTKNVNSSSITSISSTAANGSQTVSPSQTTTYTGVFTGDGGVANCSAKVTVTLAPGTPLPAIPTPVAGAVSSSGYSTIGWTTSGDLTTAAQPLSPSALAAAANGAVNIKVSPSTSYQTIDGFGGNFTDSTAYTIFNLPISLRNSIMQHFFQPGVDLSVSMIRIPMGSSDLALNHYTYDDLAPASMSDVVPSVAGATDPSLTNFSFAHDDAYIVPLVQQALSYNPKLKIILTPWSPPAWMKTPVTLYGKKNGVESTVNPIYYPALAQYFVKTIQANEARNIPIWGLTPQNEPQFATTGYPGNTFTAAQEATFIGNYLGPALKAATSSLHPNGMFNTGSVTSAYPGGVPAIKLLGYDHNWNDEHGGPATFPQQLLANSAASQYISGIAWHDYTGDVSMQTTFHNQFPTIPLYETEFAHLKSDNNASGLQGTLATYMFGNLQNYGRSFLWWTMTSNTDATPYAVENGNGCDACVGLINIDPTMNAVYDVQHTFLAHITRVIDVGAQHIASTNYPNGVYSVAFLNPNGTRGVILWNSTGSPTSVTVTDDNGYSVTTQLASHQLVSLRYGKL